MNDPIMKMNRSQIRQMQEKKMRRFFREQIPFHPYYSKRYRELNIDLSSIRTIEDLQKLPLTRKKDIAPNKEDPARFKKFVLQPTPELIKRTWPKGKLIKLATSKAAKAAVVAEYSPVHMTATSGTTGTNVPFVYTPYDMEMYGRSYVRAVTQIGLPPGTRVLNLFPFAPHLAFYMVLIGGWQGRMFIYHTGGGAVTPTMKAIDLVQKLESEAVVGIPSYLYHFFLKAVEAGAKTPKLTRVLAAGERFPSPLKDKIEKMASEMGSQNVQTYDVYGTTEMRTAITECTPKTYAFHTHPDLHIYELVDPDTGKQVAEGEKGVLAVTNIDGRGSVVVRYLIGDIFEKGLHMDQCPHCGTYIPRLIGPVGRRKDYEEDLQLTKIKGTLVNLYSFYEIMPTIDVVDEWQVVITKKDNDPYEVDVLTLNIATKKGKDPETVCKLVKDTINTAMEVTPRVEIFRDADTLFDLMGGKVKPIKILDDRPKIEGSEAAAVAGNVMSGPTPNGPKAAN